MSQLNKSYEDEIGLKNKKKIILIGSIAAVFLIIGILVCFYISQKKDDMKITTIEKYNQLSAEERSGLLDEASERVSKENEAVSQDLKLLKKELLVLKDQTAETVKTPNDQMTTAHFEELLEKVQSGTATKKEVETLTAMIEYLKSIIQTKAEQKELDKLKTLLDGMQNSTGTGTDLTKVIESIDVLKKEIEDIKKNMSKDLSKDLETSDTKLEEKINNITIRINDLEKAIQNNHYTKNEIDVMIADINAAIVDINNNTLLEINNKIETLSKDIKNSINNINTSISNINNDNTDITSKIEQITNDISNSNTDIKNYVDTIVNKVNDLEKEIQNNHYTKNEINVMIKDINTAISYINNNQLVEIKKAIDEIKNKNLVELNNTINNIRNEMFTIINSKIEEITKDIINSNESLSDEIEKILEKINDLEKSVAENHYTKDEINIIIADINKSITDINVAIDDINNNSLVDINNKIEQITNNITNSITDINTKIEDINKNKLTNIYVKIDDITNDIKNSITDINTSIDNINNNQLVDINNKIEQITNNITDSDIDIKEYIATVVDKIDELEVAIANRHYTKDEIDVMISGINVSINNINDNLITKINKDITDITNRTNTSISKINKDIGNLNSLKTTDKSSVVNAINEVFQSVSNAKTLLASAITDKGINTDATDSFQTMAQNIRGLITMSSNPDVSFNHNSWTAPVDCVAVVSFSYTMECNSDYEQKARIYLRNSPGYWDFDWGDQSSSDAGWHTRGTQGNVTFEARQGVTYSFDINPFYWSEGDHAKGNILTSGWTSTWIKSGGSRSRMFNNMQDIQDNYYDNIIKSEENFEFDVQIKEDITDNAEAIILEEIKE